MMNLFIIFRVWSPDDLNKSWVSVTKFTFYFTIFRLITDESVLLKSEFKFLHKNVLKHELCCVCELLYVIHIQRALYSANMKLIAAIFHLPLNDIERRSNLNIKIVIIIEWKMVILQMSRLSLLISVKSLKYLHISNWSSSDLGVCSVNS